MASDKTRSQIAKANFAESKVTRARGRFSNKSREIMEAEADARRDHDINVFKRPLEEADARFNKEMARIEKLHSKHADRLVEKASGAPGQSGRDHGGNKHVEGSRATGSDFNEALHPRDDRGRFEEK